MRKMQRVTITLSIKGAWKSLKRVAWGSFSSRASTRGWRSGRRRLWRRLRRRSRTCCGASINVVSETLAKAEVLDQGKEGDCKGEGGWLWWSIWPMSQLRGDGMHRSSIIVSTLLISLPSPRHLRPFISASPIAGLSSRILDLVPKLFHPSTLMNRQDMEDAQARELLHNLRWSMSHSHSRRWLRVRIILGRHQSLSYYRSKGLSGHGVAHDLHAGLLTLGISETQDDNPQPKVHLGPWYGWNFGETAQCVLNGGRHASRHLNPTQRQRHGEAEGTIQAPSMPAVPSFALPIIRRRLCEGLAWTR